MKDERKDGGPAFPRPTEQTVYGFEGTQAGENGMSLRDYFAIHGPDPSEEAIRSELGFSDIRMATQDDRFAAASRLRYRHADVMLAERQK